MEQTVNGNMTISNICNLTAIKEEDILNLYMCGSRVYGTAEVYSDWLVILLILLIREGIFWLL